MQSKYVNVYEDQHTGGWIREILDLDGRWVRVGYYGSRAAALA